jgi:hypothetical protein
MPFQLLAQTVDFQLLPGHSKIQWFSSLPPSAIQAELIHDLPELRRLLPNDD